MTSLLRSAWSWITGQPEITMLPPDILFERDVSPDNDFWISCILNPTLELKYVNGIVTKILDTDKFLINGKYHYQPKTDREVRNISYMELNSAVRLSLYRKKNSNAEWQVASCFLIKDGSHHQARAIDTVRDHLNDVEPNVQINEANENKVEDVIEVEVLGDMPKVVGYEENLTIQILFRNNSYIKDQELLDYRTGNEMQLSVVNKIKLPKVIEMRNECIFDINLKGKYIGKSTEKVEFIFKSKTYKVGVNIDVVDSRVIVPCVTGVYIRREVDVEKLFELKTDTIIPGSRGTKRVQFPGKRVANWSIPSQLTNCFMAENGKNIAGNEAKENIAKLYPAAFEALTYQNYKAKFHTLLFIEEIEVTINLQKYAQERIHFQNAGDYLVLKIPDLSEQRPSIICGDRIVVRDPPNCTKRLGDTGAYEGIVHRTLANEIWLKFDPEFHSICGHWDYSVSFFNARMTLRKKHEVINELWKKNRLGESFLFPYTDILEYKPPKLEIISEVPKLNTDCGDNLNNENTALMPRPKIIQKIRWFNGMLNPEQKSAVINILKGEGRPMPYIIYGPPGTGKTITLTESIIQVYKEFPKSKLLVCAPTNSAVDILLGKLINTGLFDPTVLKRLVGYNHFISLSYNMDFDDYCVLPEFENSHQADNKLADSKLIKKKDILKLRVVVTTAGTAGLLYMMGIQSGTFSHIFIDEAGQSMEPEILLPLTFLDPRRDGQVVLAGDPKQLGPVLISILAKSSGLGQSMLARFINYPSYQMNIATFPEYNGYNPKLITHLIRNYRSLPEIVHIYSKLFYKSLLVPTKLYDNVRERIILNDLNENVHWDIGCKGPVIVHGIKGEDCQEPNSPSWLNPHEAFQVLLYYTRLIKAGILADDIGIITPYSSQVLKINELLKMYHSDKLPKVGTVEMFQGQEKMVIIISMVRSKSKKGHEKDRRFNAGFIYAKERTNVSLSRAKALLIIIGDPSTMLMSNQWKYTLQHAVKENNYIGCNIPDV